MVYHSWLVRFLVTHDIFGIGLRLDGLGARAATVWHRMMVRTGQLMAGCDTIFYCDREHQKLHWKVHKKLCKKISKNKKKKKETTI